MFINCFHLTNHLFETGEHILPMSNGYVHFPESKALEYVLEMFRPRNKIARSESIFLSPTRRYTDLGASGDKYCFECSLSPEALKEQSDLEWIVELDQGFEDPKVLFEDYSLEELERLAKGYWSGKERYPGKALWEIRWTAATINKAVY